MRSQATYSKSTLPRAAGSVRWLLALVIAVVAALIATGPANAAPAPANPVIDQASGVQISLPGEVQEPLRDDTTVAYATTLENGSLTLAVSEIDSPGRNMVPFWKGATSSLTGATTSYETSEVDGRAVLDGRASGFNSRVAGGGADVFMRTRVIDGGKYLISVTTFVRQDSGSEADTDQIQRQALDTLRIPDSLRADSSSRNFAIDPDSEAYRLGKIVGTALIPLALIVLIVALVFRRKRMGARQQFPGAMGPPGQRFNPPPGWPPVPPGWRPPQGWKPDPTWPPAPPNWQWWI